MVFHLDDDMMEFLNPQQIFDIEITKNSDGGDTNKIDLTLIEIPDGFWNSFLDLFL